MKNTLILLLLSSKLFAQSWGIQGNTGINQTTDYLGTKDSNDLIIKTNNKERLKLTADGGVIFKLNGLPSRDGMDILHDVENVQEGTDVVWLKVGKQQVNDFGVFTVSTFNWQYPIFSVRENGRVLMGVNTYNTKMTGCTDCKDYRLFVKDGIKTEKVKVEVASENGWADYVFAKDYKLTSLEEVEKHILENKHLPNVPSAKEVVKNGINVAEMDAKLLEKIEELTLYLIEQNKKINEQTKRIEILEEAVIKNKK